MEELLAHFTGEEAEARGLQVNFPEAREPAGEGEEGRGGEAHRVSLTLNKTKPLALKLGCPLESSGFEKSRCTGRPSEIFINWSGVCSGH